MPHGLPDWGLAGPKNTVYGLDDMAELAARLGSPVVWDRRGDVLFVTQFDEGMGAVAILTGGLGSGAQLVTGLSRAGAYAVQLTAGSNGTRSCGVGKWLSLPVSSRYGLEFSFSSWLQSEAWQAQMVTVDGALQCSGVAKIYCQTGRLVYLDAALAEIEIATIGMLSVLGRCPHVLKLVIDQTTHEYVRVILDDVTHDLTGIPLWTGPLVAPADLQTFCTHIGQVATNAVAAMDCLVVTENEP